MRVLWLTNFPMPLISIREKLPVINNEGWIVGISDELIKRQDIEFICIFPQDKYKNIICRKDEDMTYYGFCKGKNNDYNYIYKQFLTVVSNENPDVIHIFGTEFFHAFVMLQLAINKGIQYKTIISIQGLISICAQHYYAGLPNSLINSYTIRDFLRHDNIKIASKKFTYRGLHEIKLLKMAYHIIGRTELDYGYTRLINKNIKYHFCGEILRNSFYENVWDVNKCQRKSIFITQGNYPLKGLHYLIQALIVLKERYNNNITLYVSGRNIIKSDTLIDKLKTTSYGKYIKKLIYKNNLEDNIVFLGNLDEKDICEQYLKSNVMISASAIENSSNSIGEGMILGIPIVASYVGGTSSIVAHEKEALLYPYDEPILLAHYICKIIDNDELAIKLSKNARKRALLQYDKKVIIEQLITIYNQLKEK